MKNRKVTALLTMLLAVALLLTACGGSGTQTLQDKVVGKWSNEDFTKMVTDDATFAELIGEVKEQYVEFTKDGKLLIVVNGKDLVTLVKEMAKEKGLESLVSDEVLSSFNFTYSIEGEKMMLKLGAMAGEAQALNVKFDGDKMTLEADGTSTVFTKVK